MLFFINKIFNFGTVAARVALLEEQSRLGQLVGVTLQDLVVIAGYVKIYFLGVRLTLPLSLGPAHAVNGFPDSNRFRIMVLLFLVLLGSLKMAEVGKRLFLFLKVEGLLVSIRI